jgi:hypothetical protein
LRTKQHINGHGFIVVNHAAIAVVFTVDHRHTAAAVAAAAAAVVVAATAGISFSFAHGVKHSELMGEVLVRSASRKAEQTTRRTIKYREAVEEVAYLKSGCEREMHQVLNS